MDLAAASGLANSGDGLADAGVPAGAELLGFVTAAQEAADDPGPDREAVLRTARGRLMDVVGTDGLVEAAGTVAVFNGLVRVADGTGIQLDDGVLSASADFRGELGVDSFAGADNSTDPRQGVTIDRADVRGLFR